MSRWMWPVAIRVTLALALVHRRPDLQTMKRAVDIPRHLGARASFDCGRLYSLATMRTEPLTQRASSDSNISGPSIIERLVQVVHTFAKVLASSSTAASVASSRTPELECDLDRGIVAGGSNLLERSRRETSIV
nr:hypothetical protein CFP56_44270 [Quercus suber]